jgi:hypothetical protein
MSSSDAIVGWIFDRLALDVALVGDLREERAQGRSTIWHWRQVLIAICIGISRPIFQHKVLALRALATGCAVNAVWLFLWSKFLHVGLPVRPEISFESIGSLAIILLTQVATGWVVARTHRPYAIPMVLVFVIWLVLWHLGSSSEVKALLAGSFGKPEFLPYLVWYLAPECVVVVGLLLGSIAGASATKGTPSVPKVD